MTTSPSKLFPVPVSTPSMHARFSPAKPAPTSSTSTSTASGSAAAASVLRAAPTGLFPSPVRSSPAGQRLLGGGGGEESDFLNSESEDEGQDDEIALLLPSPKKPSTAAMSKTPSGPASFAPRPPGASSASSGLFSISSRQPPSQAPLQPQAQVQAQRPMGRTNDSPTRADGAQIGAMLVPGARSGLHVRSAEAAAPSQRPEQQHSATSQSTARTAIGGEARRPVASFKRPSVEASASASISSTTAPRESLSSLPSRTELRQRREQEQQQQLLQKQQQLSGESAQKARTPRVPETAVDADVPKLRRANTVNESSSQHKLAAQSVQEPSTQQRVVSDDPPIRRHVRQRSAVTSSAARAATGPEEGKVPVTAAAQSSSVKPAVVVETAAEESMTAGKGRYGKLGSISPPEPSGTSKAGSSFIKRMREREASSGSSSSAGAASSSHHVGLGLPRSQTGIMAPPTRKVSSDSKTSADKAVPMLTVGLSDTAANVLDTLIVRSTSKTDLGLGLGLPQSAPRRPADGLGPGVPPHRRSASAQVTSSTNLARLAQPSSAQTSSPPQRPGMSPSKSEEQLAIPRRTVHQYLYGREDASDSSQRSSEDDIERLAQDALQRSAKGETSIDYEAQRAAIRAEKAARRRSLRGYVPVKRDQLSDMSRDGESDRDSSRIMGNSSLIGPASLALPREPRRGPLRGLVVLVDVRAQDGEDAGAHWVDMLRRAGAKVYVRPSPEKEYTHIVYKSGRPATLHAFRAHKDPKPFVVGVQWVLRCCEAAAKVDEEPYLIEVGKEAVFQKVSDGFVRQTAACSTLLLTMPSFHQKRVNMAPKAAPVVPVEGAPKAAVDVDLIRRKSLVHAPAAPSPLGRKVRHVDDISMSSERD